MAGGVHLKPHHTVSHLVTGHFHERGNYAVWRPRGSADYLLILTLDGSGRFGYRGGEVVCQRGDIALLAPGTLHDYGIAHGSATWELAWSHFYARPHWHELLNWPEVAPGLFHLRLPADVFGRAAGILLQAHQHMLSGQRRRELFAMNQLELLLLTCDLHNPRSDQLDPRIRQTLDYVCANLSRRHTMQSLSHHCRLSVSRLAHLFRQQVGQSPQQFVELQRINRAKELLALTPRTIQTIALDVGFPNPFYFSLRFRKHVGMSPRAYRKAMERK